MEAKNSTVDAAEVEQFSRLSSEWWNPYGPFKPLHAINPLRISWIKERIITHFQIPDSRFQIPLTLLDIGCGGGLVCEPLAALGAQVTGIDASAQNIEAAKLHAGQSGLTIDYQCISAEELLASRTTNNEQPTTLFDVVLALEIVEHVANVPLFVETVCKLARPGGLIIMSTLNRTAKSLALAVVGAEYILRMLPRGTHQWEKFLKPSELAAHLRRNDVEIAEMTGMVMDPLTFQWRLNPRDLGVNYLTAAKKPSP